MPDASNNNYKHSVTNGLSKHQTEVTKVSIKWIQQIPNIKCLVLIAGSWHRQHYNKVATPVEGIDFKNVEVKWWLLPLTQNKHTKADKYSYT